MRDYEAIFVFRPEDELYNKGKELIKQELENASATIVKEEDMGARDLAYAVKKETRGHYHFYEAQIEPQKLESITSSIKLMDSVLKYLFVRK